MKESDLKSANELRKRIEVWIAQKKAGVVTDEEKKRREATAKPVVEAKSSVSQKPKEKDKANKKAYLADPGETGQFLSEDEELARAIQLSLDLGAREDEEQKKSN